MQPLFLASTLLLAASVSAHGGVMFYTIEGKKFTGKAEGNPWPHAGGPITVSMAACKGDCSTWADPSQGEWFKIFQSGLISGTIGHGKWGTNEMMEKGFQVTTKIPASLKAGNYLIRHETINLARAPAEFYPECAQLKVSGSGTSTPGKEFLFKLPGAYKSSDSAIKYSMHDAPVSSSSKYVIPGPAVWKGGAGGASAAQGRTHVLLVDNKLDATFDCKYLYNLWRGHKVVCKFRSRFEPRLRFPALFLGFLGKPDDNGNYATKVSIVPESRLNKSHRVVHKWDGSDFFPYQSRVQKANLVCYDTRSGRPIGLRIRIGA
ncbi:hypothetical protein FKW77_006222 [Venturia effusa]|uniref:AA9 family lytic polysaccharide monooxygenase n=1 Tax=Venturia effusa TaxID=50376 RepID=A0A517LQB2_9PEZI|nr:hypothetical protein FKW77_006222 [Venturia effusa]